jgi:hypothetical protein
MGRLRARRHAGLDARLAALALRRPEDTLG